MIVRLWSLWNTPLYFAVIITPRARHTAEISPLSISIEKWVVGGELTSHTQRPACLVQTHIPELVTFHRRYLISRTCTAGNAYQ